MRVFQYKSGAIIRKSGAYINVPIETYHGGFLCEGWSISSTGLRRVLESPAHYWSAHPLNPDRLDDADFDRENRVLVLGSACHCWAFERELFSAQFLVIPSDAPRRPSAVQRRAKKPSEATLEAIAFWDNVAASGKSVLTNSDFDDVQAMATAMQANDMARGLFSGGLPEVTYVAKVKRDEETALWVQCADDDAEGVWLLARPDYTPTAESRSLLDYKTTGNARPEKWQRHAFDLGYDIQAELALWVFEMATVQKRVGMAHVIQETKPPFVIQTGRWDLDDLAEARMAIHRALDRLYQGINFNQWPAYDGEAFDIIKPKYLRREAA